MQRTAVGERYRGITVDNRGTGRSDKPPGPYSLLQMADDACRVIDAAGYESAHLVGASMGGVLAQIIAVLQPHRARSLVLACTACRHEPWRRELLEEWIAAAAARGMRAFARENARWLIGPRSLRRFWPLFDLLSPLALSAPTHAFVAQARAILDLDDDVRAALANISVPTLVIVGSQDILTPVGDSEELAEHVPGAELVVIRGAAHGFMVEAFRPFNSAVLEFLQRASATGVEAPARSKAVGLIPSPVAAVVNTVATVPATLAAMADAIAS